MTTSYFKSSLTPHTSRASFYDSISYRNRHHSASLLIISVIVLCNLTHLGWMRQAQAKGIASVNDQPVNQQSYILHYQQLLKTHPHAVGNLKLERLLAHRALSPLVIELLLRQKADEINLKLEDNTYQDPITELFKQYKTDQKVKQYLQRIGETEATLRLKHWSATMVRALMHKLGLLTVTDEQLRAEYQKQEKRLKQPEKMRAWQVLLEMSPSAQPDEIERVRVRAQKIYNRLKQGEITFEFAVRRHSEGPLKFKQGDLGFVMRGQLVESIETAIWSLKRREISAPVKSQYGWHIMRRGQRLAPVHKTAAQVRPQLIKRLEGRNFHAKKRNFIKKLWRSARIESEIPLRY